MYNTKKGLLDGIEERDGAHLYGSDGDTGRVGFVGLGSHQVHDVAQVSERETVREVAT